MLGGPVPKLPANYYFTANETVPQTCYTPNSAYLAFCTDFTALGAAAAVSFFPFSEHFFTIIGSKKMLKGN